MLNEINLNEICSNFSIDLKSVDEFIDSSKSSEDIRYNYLINNKYFLKVSNNQNYDEIFFKDMDMLIKNYQSIGIYCPALIRTKDNNLFVSYECQSLVYICYIEEKSEYPVRSNKIERDYQFKKSVIEHLGVFASNYSNKNLSETRSMWSIIELCAYDTGIDEKQENFDLLCDSLIKIGKDILVEQLVKMNQDARNRIKNEMSFLPKTVFQGDLNESNILVDERDDFKGIIDFNMYGTEININCFLNEAMYYLTENDFNCLSGDGIFEKTKNIQNDLMSIIIKHYSLSREEKDMIKDYNRIIFSSFYPNTSLMVELIDKNIHIDKVIAYLNALLKY